MSHLLSHRLNWTEIQVQRVKKLVLYQIGWVMNHNFWHVTRSQKKKFDAIFWKSVQNCLGKTLFYTGIVTDKNLWFCTWASLNILIIPELKQNWFIDMKKIWYWGPSTEYGFQCFNELQNNGLCEDFEYRIYTNCCSSQCRASNDDLN